MRWLKFGEIFKHSVLSTLATNVVSSIGFPASTTPASVVVESILLSKKDLETAVLSNSDQNSWQKLQFRHILIHDFFFGGGGPESRDFSHGTAASTKRRSGFTAKKPTFRASPIPPDVLRNFLSSVRSNNRSPERSSIYGSLVIHACAFWRIHSLKEKRVQNIS